MQRRSARGQSGGGSLKARLVIGVIIALFSIFSFFASRQFNPITGEDQYLSLTPNQEIALGLQALPEITQQYGGLAPDQEAQALVDEVGFRIVEQSVARNTPWQFEFHVLNDPNTVNAFALPGGQIFITTGLLSRLEGEDQLAGVLAHEIVHVLARHGAQRIAKGELTNGLIGAISVASGDASATQAAAFIGQLVNMSYGRDAEIQSDTLGVCLMISSEYDPQGMAEVMQILAEAAGPNRQPEFFSTHPNPDNRIERIQTAIQNAARDCP
jgi:predicted Zn-dependent protease